MCGGAGGVLRHRGRSVLDRKAAGCRRRRETSRGRRSGVQLTSRMRDFLRCRLSLDHCPRIERRRRHRIRLALRRLRFGQLDEAANRLGGERRLFDARVRRNCRCRFHRRVGMLHRRSFNGRGYEWLRRHLRGGRMNGCLGRVRHDLDACDTRQHGVDPALEISEHVGKFLGAIIVRVAQRSGRKDGRRKLFDLVAGCRVEPALAHGPGDVLDAFGGRKIVVGAGGRPVRLCCRPGGRVSRAIRLCSRRLQFATRRWRAPSPEVRRGSSGKLRCCVRESSLRCARSRRAPAWSRRDGRAWRIRSGTSGRARSP